MLHRSLVSEDREVLGCWGPEKPSPRLAAAMLALQKQGQSQGIEGRIRDLVTYTNSS